MIAVKDGSGNVSQQLVIRIPDIKNAGSGTGNNDNNSSVIHRPGSGEHKSEAGRPGSGSDGNGSKANLKKVSGTGSSGQAGEKNGTSTDQKKTGSKGKKKDAGKSEDQKKADEKKSGTSGKSSGKKAETTDGYSSSVLFKWGVPERYRNPGRTDCDISDCRWLERIGEFLEASYHSCSPHCRVSELLVQSQKIS